MAILRRRLLLIENFAKQKVDNLLGERLVACNPRRYTCQVIPQVTKDRLQIRLITSVEIDQALNGP